MSRIGVSSSIDYFYHSCCTSFIIIIIITAPLISWSLVIAERWVLSSTPGLGKKVLLGFYKRYFSVVARSLKVGGMISRASESTLSRWSCAWSFSVRVGLPSLRIMRVKEQRFHLCLRTHLCTIISPTQMPDLCWDWPPRPKLVRRTIITSIIIIRGLTSPTLLNNRHLTLTSLDLKWRRGWGWSIIQNNN